jgi:hypothetical protein
VAKNTEPDKLAQESTAALAAGMSYGKWKAMQNPVTIQKPPPPEGWRTCVWCGQPFKPKNKGVQKYCESTCQLQAQTAKYRQNKAERSTKEE